MIDSSDDENAAPKQAASSPASATANGGGSAAASPAARGKPAAAAAAALFSEDDDEGGANDDASDVKKSSPSSQGPAGGSKPSSAKPPKAPKPKAVKAPGVAPGKKAKKAPVAAAKETGDGPASSPGSSSSGAKKRPSEGAGSGEKAKKKKKTGAEAAAGGGKKTAGSGSASKPPLPKKKLPTVPAEVEKDIRKAARMEVGRRKNDARSKVVSSFKRESALYAPPAAEAPASMEEDVPMDPPPEPAPSVLSALGPEQRSRLVACCNFLYTFARPLGLLYVPSLEKLAEALRTLDEPSAAGSAASTGGGDEGSEGEENEARAEAERLLEDLCLALVRAMAPDLEKTLGLHTGGNESALEHVSIGRGASGTKGGAGSGLVLPLNKLTWREVARLSLTTFVLDNVGLDDEHIHEVLRGRNHYRKSRLALKLLKMRLEHRSKQGGPAAPANAGKTSTSDSVGGGGDSDADAMAVDKDGEGASASASAAAGGATRGSGGDEAPGSAPMSRVGSTASLDRGPSGTASVASTAEGTADAGSAAVKEEEDAGSRATGTSSAAAAGKKKGGGSGGGEDEEEEEDEQEENDDLSMVAELSGQLAEVLSDPGRSEVEKRLAYVLKKLLKSAMAEKVGTQGAEDGPDMCGLADYGLEIWQPLTVATLVAALVDGAYRPGQGGVAQLARDVDLLCRNTWACNLEDSEAWAAAEKFLALFERLLQLWVLDDTERRPSLEALAAEAEHPCAVCHEDVDVRHSERRAICARCSFSVHWGCLPKAAGAAAGTGPAAGASGSPVKLAAPLEPEDDVWYCADCLGARVRGQSYPALGYQPETEAPPAYVAQVGEEACPTSKDMAGWMRTAIGEWGPAVAFPPLLDVESSETVANRLRADGDLFSVTGALAVLAGHADCGGAPAGSSEAARRLLVLDALCQVAAAQSDELREFLGRQESKMAALRRRLPQEEDELMEELRELGGDAAVLAWKDPASAEYMAAEAAAAAQEEEEEEEEDPGFNEQDELAICSKCEQTTKDVDDSKVVLCETCPAEIHLRCLDPTAEEAPEKAWYCQACLKAKKNKGAAAAAGKKRVRPPVRGDDIEDLAEAERARAEAELMEALVAEKLEAYVAALRAEKEKSKAEALASSPGGAARTLAAAAGAEEDDGASVASKASTASGRKGGKVGGEKGDSVLMGEEDAGSVAGSAAAAAAGDEKSGKGKGKKAMLAAASPAMAAALAAPGKEGKDGQPLPKCEYCGFTELDMCSPLVLGQTAAETREYIEMDPSQDAWVQAQLKKKAARKAKAEKAKAAAAAAAEAAGKGKKGKGKKDGDAGSEAGDAASVAGGGSTAGDAAAAAAEEEKPPAVVAPLFPPKDSAQARKLLTDGTGAAAASAVASSSAAAAPDADRPRRLPVVHERCALQMLSLRARALRVQKETAAAAEKAKADGEAAAAAAANAEQAEGAQLAAAVKKPGKRQALKAAVEAAFRISGARTYALGQDRHGRAYWKLPGDDGRLYVWTREAGLAQGDGLGPGGRGVWDCYEGPEEIARVLAYLDARSPQEAALKPALEAAFLGEVNEAKLRLLARDESTIVRARPQVEEEQEAAAMEVDGVVKKEAEEEDGGGVVKMEDGEEGDQKTVAVDAGPKPEPGAANGSAAGAGDDDKTVTTDGEKPAAGDSGLKPGEERRPVALKFIEGKCQAPIPPEVVHIEMDPDMWGESLEDTKKAVRKARKFWAVALVDQEDRIWDQNRPIGVTFQIYKGGVQVEESHTPRAHKDFIFWFSVHDFLLPGIYTLRFMPEPFSKDIKPLCLRVEVHARRAPASLRSLLNSQLSFLNVSRGGRYSMRQSLELDIPEAADEVAALRIALLQLKETLPFGALIESEDDLVTAGTGGGAGFHSPAPSGGGGGGSGSGNTLKAPPCFWTLALGEQWMNHLMEATTAQEVMEGLVLLEACLHPDWLKPWYGGLRRAYAASWAHLLRVGTTPAVVAFHLFVLDKAILYDKERRAPRKTRGRLAAAASSGAGQQQQPYRRMTNTSRLAELSAEEDEDEEEDFEATETESEEEEDSDDEWSASGGKRKARGRAAKPARPQKKRVKKAGASASASSSRSGRAAAAPHRYSGRRRTQVDSYREQQEDDIGEESEEEGSRGSSSRGGRSSLGGGDVTQEELLHVLSLLTQHQSSGLFIDPVDEAEVPDYYQVITKPMCLSEMERRVKAGKYAGLGLDAFAKDLALIWENAKTYNGAPAEVTRLARELKAAFEEWARGRKRTRSGAR